MNFFYRVSDELDERRLQLPFPHRASLTFVLMELDYAQTYAVGKECVDAEGALFARAAANVEALSFPVLNLVSFSNTEIMASDSG